MKIVAIVVGSLVALFVGSAAVVGVIESVGGGGEGSGSGGKAKVGKPDGYVRVTRVIDGDSVVLTRFGETRLIGVNTPEEGRCYETEATRFTRDRLEGQRVGYEFDKDRKDRYGRTLAYLYRDGMHNLALVEKGYAKALTIEPNDKYASRFREAERNTKQSRTGLFSGECERRRRAAAQERRERRRPKVSARDADGDGKVDDAPPKSDSGSGGGDSGRSGGGDSGGGGEDHINIPGLPGD